MMEFTDLTYHEKRVMRNRKLRSDRLKKAKLLGKHTKKEWEAVKNEFPGRCVKCGKFGNDIFKDHIKPLYLGGSDHITNLQPLCWSCNSSKGACDFNYLEFRRKEGF